LPKDLLKPKVEPKIEQQVYRPVVEAKAVLKIMSNTSGVIKIDGDSYGNIEANKIKIIELKAGDYFVQLFPSNGIKELTKELTLTAGQNKTHNFEVKDEAINTVSTIPEDKGPKIEMVPVPGGKFTMGCTAEQGSDCWGDEKPAHTVTLSSYYIGKYEVTQAQWEAVMGSNPSRFKGCANCPVENVSWNDVQDFISKLNAKTGKKYRLPTEAEWEYAARGGSSSRGYKYAGSNAIAAVAWYDGNSNDKTHPFGQKSPNELGIYDMTGNVWEWCSDWYGESYYSSSPSNNPQGPSSGSDRVLRGGSWGGAAATCRVADRNRNSPEGRNSNGGFRVLLSQ
jgi:formylglycine-generating enzyme required for sulfatase activity